MALGEGVRVVAILGFHAPDTGGAVEGATVGVCVRVLSVKLS